MADGVEETYEIQRAKSSGKNLHLHLHSRPLLPLTDITLGCQHSAHAPGGQGCRKELQTDASAVRFSLDFPLPHLKQSLKAN